VDKAPPLPPGAVVRRQAPCGVAEFRALYDAVGADHLWWLRRTLSDAALAAHLAKPGIAVHVLSNDGRAAGFHELERLDAATVNLNYFGLFPQFIGRGLGRAFLRHAIDLAWSWGPRVLTVNTCTADHPRALPTYLAAGFAPTRAVDEVWDVPTRLGLRIPPTLRRL
jgi:GNAT superfamily N-acetyltransferase